MGAIERLLKLEEMKADAEKRASKVFTPDDDFDYEECRYAYCDVCEKTTKQTIETTTDMFLKGDICNPAFHKNTTYQQDYWFCSECDMDVMKVGRVRYLG